MDLSDVQQQLGDAWEFVLNDIRDKFKQLNGGPGILDSLMAFIAAVDWTERWIIALLATHVLLLLTVLLFRKNSGVQGIVFVTIMGVVYNAERLNSLAAQHWKKFATQNYFDRHGIFASAVLSGPLLVIMFIQLVIYLLAVSKLLVQMKRKELLYKARQQRKEAAAAAGQPAEGKKQK